MSETPETPESNEDLKPHTPSKLDRIKSAAFTAGFYGACAAVTGGSMYFSWKLVNKQLEAAKLNLEAAKLTQQSS